MKARTLTDGVLLIALAATTACSGITYNDDFDPEAAFSDYKTFTWITAENPEEVSKGVSPLVQRRVDRAVEDQLEAKGYERAAARGDIFVNWYVGTEQKMDVTTYSHGWGYYGWYGGSTTSVRQWTEGTLVIDIIDAKTKELVWRGWAKGAMEPDATPERVTERINEIVAGILKRFPPDQG